MLSPQLLDIVVTCPSCQATSAAEAILFLLSVVFTRHLAFHAITWAICAACHHEWKLAVSVAHHALPVT